MGKIALVTGVNGFVGKHLVRELKSRNISVIGVGREEAHNEILSLLSYYRVCDLTKPEEVAQLPIEEADCIINLAGLARVGSSFNDLDEYIRVNVNLVSILGGEIIRRSLKTRLLAISSGGVYDPSQKNPFSEESLLVKDGSPYAISKVKMEESIHKLLTSGLNGLIVRPFNHIGPGQEEGFLIPDLYKKIKISLHTNNPIRVGDLSTKRDYTDVRDVVRAYADLAFAEKLTHHTYNVCSGTIVEGKEVLEALLSVMNASEKTTIEIDKTLIRPTDPKELRGNNHRIFEELGWQPQIKLHKTLEDFVAYEKQKTNL